MNPILELVISFLPFILIIYFLLIRPQKKQQKQISEMLDSLKKGDEIVTVGGVVGKIITIKDNDIVIETGLKNESCKIKFQKAAVGRVLKATDVEEVDKAKDEEFED